MHDEVMTIEETAEFLKLCPQTVWNLLKRGELPGRQVGKKWRTTKRALLDYLDGKDNVRGDEETEDE